MNVSPLNKLMDRSRTEGEAVSTFRWWSVAANRCESFKEIDGQVENQRRKCFYFAMMIRSCWWISLLQGHLRTGGELKEKVLLLCDDELLLQTDASPSNKLMDRSRTQGENLSTFRWWSVAANRFESFKQIDGQVENERRNCLYFVTLICCCKQMWVLQTNWWTEQIDGQVENERRNCLYFAMLIRCCKQMWVLQTNWWTGREPK